VASVSTCTWAADNRGDEPANLQSHDPAHATASFYNAITSVIMHVCHDELGIMIPEGPAKRPRLGSGIVRSAGAATAFSNLKAGQPVRYRQDRADLFILVLVLNFFLTFN
jgi:hypothetical protein